MKSKYRGPFRPIAPSKEWLEGDGFKATSWSYNQSSNTEPIYVPPSYYKRTYAVIDDSGYPYDMMDLEFADVFVDLLVNEQTTLYNLNG